MTAPPGAPWHTADDESLAPQQPSTTAFDLLSRAQAIADVLRSEVEAEVSKMREEAAAAQDEARRLLAEATNVHDNALSTQRSALARLKEAQEQSAQLVADAADQATLVATAANLATESLLASTQAEADEVRQAALTRSKDLRVLATTELDQVRAQNSALLSESASGIEARQLQGAAELRALREEANQHCASIRAATEQFSIETISAANTEAEATRALTGQELAQARAEVAELRSTAATETTAARDAANGEAEHVLGDAADHMSWTQDTIAALLLTAKAEADRVRQADLETSSVHLAARRRQLQDVISRVSLRVRTHLAEAAAEAARLRAQAKAIIEAADKDSIATRDRALAHAQRVVAEADLTAEAATTRGQRRLDEAEGGAARFMEDAKRQADSILDDADRQAMARREEAEALYERSRAKSANAAVDFETTLAARRDSSALEFAAEVTAAEQQLATVRMQSEQTRIESEQSQQEAATRSEQQLEQAMNHAHTLVSEAKTKADRIRGDSERELAAATQRRDSINAQLSNVRQMLTALGGVAVAGSPELTQPAAGQSKPAPVAAHASQHQKAVTDVHGGKDVAKTVALDTSKARDNEPKATKATDEKLNDKGAGSGQTIGAKG